jgi:ketosteroid isomerase-like protein
MKTQRIVLLAMLVFMFLPVARSQGKSNTSSFMTTMFRKKTVEWQEAFNNKDLGKLAQFYAEDAEYIASGIKGLAVSGRDKVLSNFQLEMSKNSHMDSIEIISLDISDGLASVYSKYMMTAGKTTRSGRNIMVLKKDGVKWLIILHMVVEDNQ